MVLHDDVIAMRVKAANALGLSLCLEKSYKIDMKWTKCARFLCLSFQTQEKEEKILRFC